MSKPVTIEVRISRDELAKDQHKRNQVITGQRVMSELRRQGVPVVGVLAIFGVEHGTLTMRTEDGLDGDEFIYTWTGVPIAPELRKHQFTFTNTLANTIREEEEI